MRRRHPIKLLLLLLPVLIAGVYAGGWYYLAGRVRTNIQDWAEARRVEGFTVGWDRYAVSGFPFALRVTMEKPVFGKAAATPGYEATAPQLVGEARPWALRHWHVVAVKGAHLGVEPGPARSALALRATTVDVDVAPRRDDSGVPRLATEITVAADGLTFDGDTHLAISHAEGQAVVPGRGAASHLDTWLSGTVRLEHVTLPKAVQPFGDTVDTIAAQLSIKGAIPPGPHREALAAWSRNGGTLELENADLDWGKLTVAASGTVALDEKLQPEGALTAKISGYGEVLDALVGSGSLKEGDAALAKLALGMLAKPGPNGASQLTAPISAQNSQIFVGPVRLARLPNFTWE